MLFIVSNLRVEEQAGNLLDSYHLESESRAMVIFEGFGSFTCAIRICLFFKTVAGQR